MPKNVFEIMPILRSLTFWPRSLEFFQLIWHLTGETLSSLSCIYMGVYYLPKVKLSLFFFIQKRVLLLFAFYFCVKSKFQELWGAVQAWRLIHTEWSVSCTAASSTGLLCGWHYLFLCVCHLEASRIQPAVCLSGAFAFNKLAWGLYI